MGRDLVLSDAALEGAAARIDAVVADLASASESREALMSGLGESSRVQELRDALASFDSAWRVRREGLQESLTGLAGVLRQIDQGFDEADRSLAQVLSPPRAPAAQGREVR